MADEDATAAGTNDGVPSSAKASGDAAGGAVVEPGTPGPGILRASHADRDRVVEALRIAAGDGRLSAQELDERLELALNALTYAELAALTTDLPATAEAGILPAAGGYALAAGEEPKDLA